MADRHIGFGKELTWGTAVARNKFFEARSENFAPRQENINIETMRSISLRAVDKSHEHWGGPTDLVLNFEEAATFLYMFFGNVTTTGAGPYTHSLPGTSGVDSARKSFTAEVKRGL